MSVNSVGNDAKPIGDCNFPGGDNTCRHTDWREGSIDLSEFAGKEVEVRLLFSAVDAGDNIYDTHVLIDNIRFGTVWVSAKRITDAAVDTAFIQEWIREANEIISQAGVNVQLQNILPVTDPSQLLDTFVAGLPEARCRDSVWKLVPTSEELQLMSLSRSIQETDINVYYVRSMTDRDGNLIQSAGRAVGPDDYHDIALASNAGIIFPDKNTLNDIKCSEGGHLLAHELGHLLISPEKAGDTLEHNAAQGNFMSKLNGCGVPKENAVLRQQSSKINISPLVRY